jgi:opacity protein-like surface antigen
MKMKRLWLASTALALLAGAQQAQADMYISVLGGANFLEDSTDRAVSGSTTLSISTDADTGFVLGGAIGAHLDKWAKGLRAEVEASYRRHDVGGLGSFASFYTNTSSALIDMNQSTFAIMANVLYDIDVGMKIKPYVMGGAGWARSKVDGAIAGTDTTTTFVDHSNGFAWQLGVGFNYEVQPGVDLGLGYRYFNGPDNDLVFRGKNETVSNRVDNQNHSLMVNLTVDIN